MHRLRVIGLLAVFGSIALACGGSGSPSPQAPTATTAGSEAAWSRAVLALCEARDKAASGDPSAAKETFFDRAHGPLHEIASAVQEVDRSSAGTLLEAKQRVEADLQASPAPSSLKANLTDLAKSAGDAVERLEMKPPSCTNDVG